MKTVLAFIVATVLSTAAGCAAANSSDAGAEGATESALSASDSAAKQAIKKSIGFFDGGDAAKTHAIQLREAPAAVAPALKSAKTELVRELTGPDGFASNESDLSEGIYEVFKSAHDHTIVGYAVWAYGDNGDAGRGMVRGFNLAGHEIVRDEDTWAEN